MQRSKIVDTEFFALWSYGNGTAYALVHSAYDIEPNDENSFMVQDNDAILFRNDWEKLEDEHPNASTDWIMRQLWNLYRTD